MKKLTFSALILSVLSTVAQAQDLTENLVSVAQQELNASVKAPRLEITLATQQFARETIARDAKAIYATRLVAMRTTNKDTEKDSLKAE